MADLSKLLRTMKCIYCGKSAGLFHKKHNECEQKRNDTLIKLRDMVGINGFEDMRVLALEGYVKPDELRQIIKDGFASLMRGHMAVGFVTKKNEVEADKYMAEYGITDMQIASDNTLYNIFSDYSESIKMREVSENADYEVIEWRNRCPAALGKTEKIIWMYTSVECLEDKKRTRYVGGSQGVSIRIMKWMSYRIGNHRGEKISEEYTQSMGRGDLYITTKNIIFCGPKPLKIPLTKVLTMKSYSNGTGGVKDGANPKEYTFLGITPFIIANTLSIFLD